MFVITFLACKDVKTVNVQDIIDESIEVSGGEKYSNFEMEFDFRDKHYVSKRSFGNFTYQRIFKDSVNTIKDVYTNTSFKRFVNEESVIVEDTMANKYTNSINSVNYFVLLPFGLNDEAVNKAYLGETLIKGNLYHKVKVTFNEEGGGDDFDDIYVYWINNETKKVDYLAYSYHVNGGGMRFREAYNERYVNGLRIVDYNNYKPLNPDNDLFDLDKAFENKNLKLLSKIETENVVIK